MSILRSLHRPVLHIRGLCSNLTASTSATSIKNEQDMFGVSKLFTVKDLFDARMHYGHKVGTLHENMKQFLYGQRLDICIFDLDKTALWLRDALNFLGHVVYQRGIILFVSCDVNNIHAVEMTAKRCGEYSFARKWSSGTFTDSFNRYKADIRYPDLMVFTNTSTSIFDEHPAVREAARLLIPTMGLVDSNINPNLITFPVPANDDSHTSVQLFLDLCEKTINHAKQIRPVT